MSTHRTHWNTPTRALSAVLIAGQFAIGLPAVEAATPQAPPPTKQEKRTEPPPVTVNRTVPKVAPPPAMPRFSANPTDLEISEARVFEEPILRVGGERQDSENRELATALTTYLSSGGGERTAPLQEFLSAHPGTGWRASLLLNLGLVYRRTGYFSRALNAWEEVWLLSKDASDPAGRAVADRGVGELAELNARLGRYDRLDTLFAEIEGRDVRGSAAEKVSAARQGRALMDVRPEDSFRCGPMALDRILAYGRADYRRDEKLTNAKSSLRGMSLTQVRDLARELGLDMQMTFRPPTAEPVFPAVIHWKAGHFAALIRMDGDHYLVQDPTFGNDMWVTRAALDEEGTGYMIVPAGALMPGWRAVPDAEGDGVWGKGTTAGPEPSATGPAEHTVAPSCTSPLCCNMAGHAVNTLTVNLMVIDTPVTYSPPRGPSVDFTVRHNQRDAYQPQVFSYSNLGPKWTFEWLSYLEDDPAVPAANVDLYRRGSGRETYSGFNSGTQEYAPHYKSRAVVVRTSSSPIEYERRMPDGSKEVFGQPDGGSTFPRKIFMTAWEDTAGNRVSLAFDGSLRIVAATDAIGQVTTLSYDLPTDTRKITKVTDPFGRFATFDYGTDGRLQRITDRIGITSEFTYADQDRIDSLTTPYGTTKFAFGDAGQDRWVEITDALGGRERIEYRDRTPIPPNEPVPTGFNGAATYLDYRNSIYWDKRAMAIAPGDYTKAQIFHWLHAGSNLTAGTLESEKKPLEGRVWYAYPNQSNYAAIGSMATPIKVGRILDDGTTQLYQYEYNSKGRVIRAIDPSGRETRYIYGTGNSPDLDQSTGTGLDLLTVEQKNGVGYDLLWSGAYSAQHRLLSSTNASGQSSTYSYNVQGQLLAITTPPRAGITEDRTTNYTYATNGYLEAVSGPMTGATVSYTYDGYGRIRTITDPDSYITTNDYDAVDRLTRVTFPDGTFEETRYQRLDAEQQRDRGGRWTHSVHDALGRTVAVRDSEGQTTAMQWCSCGSLDKVIDGNNNATTWERDLQGRVTREVRADNTATTFAYENTSSRLKQATDPKSQVTQLTYFIDNNLKQVSYTNAAVATPTVSFTYDPVYNRPTTILDGTGATSYTYSAITIPPGLGAGRLATIDGPLTNDNVTYSYDELGRGTSRSVDGAMLFQTYDALGRITAETNVLGSFGFSYDAASERVATVSYPNGQTTTFGYFDNLGDRRLQEVHNKLSGAVTLSRFGYTYDPTSNITSWTQQADANPMKVFEFAYDGADQVMSATLRTSQGPPPSILKRYRYAYDKAGNRSTEQVDDSVLGATYNGLNQLVGVQPGGALRFAGNASESATVSVGGTPANVAPDNTFVGSASVLSGTGTVVVIAEDASGNTRTNTYQISQSGTARSMTYDPNGNLTSDGTRTYEWDAANRLVAVNTGVHRSEFVYDGLSRRVRAIEKDNGTVTSDHRYVWCDTVICEERDAAGSSITKRFFTLGMQEAGVSYFYAKDHLGSIREVTDSAGAIRARYDYDPYGRASKLTGDKDSFFGFSGLVFHSSSGLALAQYRAYDPDTGRWLSADPLGLADGTNLYAYVHANPIGLTDPDGLLAGSLMAAGLGLLGGIVVAPAVAAAVVVATVIVAGVVVYEVVYDDPVAQTQASGNGTGDKPGSGSNPAPGTSNAPGGGTQPAPGPGTPPRPPVPGPSPSCSPGDPCKGLRDQLSAHQRKLEEYLANPYSQNNKGFLGQGRDPQVRAGRIRNLQKQIENFRKLLAECERKNGL